MFSFDFKSGDVGEFVKQFKDLSQAQQTALLTSGVFDANQQQLLATSACLTITESGQVVATESLAGAQTTATGTTSGLSAAMTGLGASLKSALVSLATNPFTYLVAGLTVGAIALHKYITAFDDAVNKAQESQSEYSSTTSEIESLNSELETTKSRIEELQALKDAGTISLAEESELSRLQNQNKEIERQIELKQKLASEQSKQAANDAIAALKIEHTQDLTQQYTTTDKNGMVTHTQNKQTDIITASKNEISELRNLKKERDNLLNDDIKDTKQTESFEKLDADIEKYTNSISSNIEQLNSLKTSFEDGNGVMRSDLSQEAQNYYKSIVDIIDSFNNIDLSPTEQALANLNNYFDGSTGKNAIKDQLQKAYDEGKNLETELNRMGLSLDDLGVENVNQLASYFQKTKQAVDEAKKSVQDYSSTVSDVEGATSSENQDKDWSTMSEAYKNAKELLKEGKTGTDDFQSVASFLNPEKIKYEAEKGGKYTADAYQKAFESVKKTANRWFGEDETKSMKNFVNDFKNKGLFDVKTDKDGLWDISTNFKTSAEAADKFGISVQAVETMLSGLEAYGYDFSKVTFSGEALSDYESALNGIKDIYDSLDKGDAKNRLWNIINKSELDDFENNIEKLKPKIVAKIKFEYELAQIDQEIQKLKEAASGEGYTNTTKNAELLATNNARSKKWRENNKKATKDEGYKNTDTVLNNLQQSMVGKTGDDLANIQRQVFAVQELRTAFENVYSTTKGGIDWNEFVNSPKADRLLNEIKDKYQVTEEEIQDIFGGSLELDIDTSKADKKLDGVLSNNDKTIVMEVDASTEQIQTQINNLQNGQTLLFTAEIDGEPTGIEAVKNIDGTITYTETVTGKEVELNKDGTVNYRIGDYPKDVPPADQTINRHPDNSEISQNPKSVNQTVKRTADNSAVNNNLPSITQKVVRTITESGSKTHSMGGRGGGGVGQASGTAHAYGTLSSKGVYNATGGFYPIPKLSARALAMGTLEDDSWLKDSWKTKNGEVALTGEIGQEIVVDPRSNRWWTVGDNGAEFSYIPKGAIVFDDKQTKGLLKNGQINSRGSALASGTAYRLTPSSGSNVSKKKTTSKKSSSKKSSSSSNKVSKKLENIINSLEKLFDWIEIKVQRLEDRIDLNLAKADNATSYTSKNAYISQAQADTNTLIATQQAAITKYTNQANAVAKKVGLSSSLKSKVDNGTIDIQSLSANDKKRVEAYQKWKEKALDAAKAVEELKQQQKELAQQKLDNIVEQYDTIVKLAESANKVSETMVDYYTSMGKTVNSIDAKNQIRSQMNQQNSITSNLQAQYNAYKAELASTASIFGTSSNEYREAAEKLNEINASLYESKSAYNDLNKQLNELDLSAIQYVIDNFEALGNKIKNVISLLEKRGANISETDYTKQIANNNNIIEQYYKDRQNRINMISQNGWEVGSEQYQEYYEAIMKDEDAIYSLLEANEDLKKSIVELRWKPFDDLQEKLSNSIDDLDFIRDLLNEDGFFGDDGTITSEGAANIALIGKAMSTAKQQIADYRKALEKVQDEYDNGNITLEEYNERSRDYIETIKDSVKAVDDFKDSLLDMYKTQMQYQNDALQEYIDKRKEALQKDKEYADYNKRLKSQNKDINSTMAQIRALEGSANKNSIAELARLRAQLKEQQDELNETVQDHEYEIKISGYDKLSEDAQKAYDDTLKALETNSEKQQEVVNLMLDKIKSSYSSAYGEIQNIISNTGLVVGKEAQSAIDSLKNVSDAINTANSAKENATDKDASNEVSNINTDKINTGTSRTDEIEKDISGDTASTIQQKTDVENARKAEEARIAAEAKAKAEAEAKAKAEAEARARAEEAARKAEAERIAKQKAEAARIAKLNSAKALINKQPKSGVKKGSKTYKKHLPLWRYVFDKTKKHMSNAAQLQLGKILGVGGLPSSSSKLSSGKKSDILKALKAVGYNKGTRRVPKKQLALLDDNKTGNLDLGSEIVVTKYGVLKQMEAGDTVFNNDQVQRLWEMSKGNFDVDRFINLNTDSMKLPEIVNNNREFNITNHYDSLLTVNGNVDQETLPKLQVILEKSYQYTTKEMAREARKAGMR